MKTKDILLPMIGLVIIMLCLTFLIGYEAGHDWKDFKSGYEQGCWHTMVYNKATGKYPTPYWRDMYFMDDLQTSEDIIDTLKEKP